MVAEAGKLIDADALNALCLSLSRTAKSNTGRNVAIYFQQEINSQPDASEPLRKRIAELEAKVAELSVLAPTKESSKAYWAQVRRDEYFEPVETGLSGDTKGAQDA